MDSLMKINVNMGSSKLKLILILIIINLVGNCYAVIDYPNTKSLLVDFCKNAYNRELISPIMEFQRKKVNAAFEISAQHDNVLVNEDYYLYKTNAFNIYVPSVLYSEFWKIITNKSALNVDFIEKNTKNDKYSYVMYLTNIDKVIFIEKNY
jgi:hypothetical protein